MPTLTIVWIAVATIVFMVAAFTINTPAHDLSGTVVKVLLTVMWFTGLLLLAVGILSGVALPAGMRWY